MFNYHPKVLVAFAEAFNGSQKFRAFLMENFPELAAFIGAIKNDGKGYDWLKANGFDRLAAIHDAIDEDMKAFDWLKQSGYNNDIKFALAVLKVPKAIKWLAKENKTLSIIANRISTYLNLKEKEADSMSGIIQRMVNPMRF